MVQSVTILSLASSIITFCTLMQQQHEQQHAFWSRMRWCLWPWEAWLEHRHQRGPHSTAGSVCSALDLSGLELDTLDTEVSDNEEEADPQLDAAAMSTLANMIARDDALETPSGDLPGPSNAFAKPPRRLAHSQSIPASMTCVQTPSLPSSTPFFKAPSFLMSLA